MKTFRTKLNAKGFSHIELLFVVLIIAAVAAAGIFVYRHDHKTNKEATTNLTQKPLVNSVPVKGNSLKSILPEASAYNLSHITSNQHGYDIYACKQYINAYGGIWHINAYYWQPAGTPNNEASTYITLQDLKPGGTRQDISNWGPFLYGRVASLQMNVPVYYTSDQIYFTESSQTPNVNIWNIFTLPNFAKYIVNC